MKRVLYQRSKSARALCEVQSSIEQYLFTKTSSGGTGLHSNQNVF